MPCQAMKNTCNISTVIKLTKLNVEMQALLFQLCLKDSNSIQILTHFYSWKKLLSLSRLHQIQNDWNGNKSSCKRKNQALVQLKTKICFSVLKVNLNKLIGLQRCKIKTLL